MFDLFEFISRSQTLFGINSRKLCVPQRGALQNAFPTRTLGTRKKICAVVNFPPRRVAGVKSEVLVLAIVCKDAGTVLIEPNLKVTNGERLA
ncbi:MAG: hypothetical protein KAI83_12780 [Thiomargarita sp.]|nr:hypothetical protein [Thiomargarita sp.]